MSSRRGTGPTIPWVGLAHLLVVYVVWSSTYLAMRVAVREGSGFPPFFMAGSRMLVGSLGLFLWATLLGQRIRISLRDLGRMAVYAVLLWVGGNGVVTWCLQWLPSGYTALVIGTTPIWASLLTALADRRRPGGRLVLSLLIGFAGLCLLNAAKSSHPQHWIAALALLLAPISWGAGSLVQQRRPVNATPLVSSAYQQWIGGLCLIALAVLLGEPFPHPIAEAWWAWGFLVVFGSLLAFTSYIIVLRTLSLPLVMTYAYVNPTLAVLMGWALLGETLSVWTIAGTLLILAGVFGIFHERFRPARSAPGLA